MKNFSELLATDLKLTVIKDNQKYVLGLYDQLEFEVGHSVIVDDIEVLPKYSHLAVDGKLIINEPFYRWYHRVSGQGWLLTPC